MHWCFVIISRLNCSTWSPPTARPLHSGPLWSRHHLQLEEELPARAQPDPERVAGWPGPGGGGGAAGGRGGQGDQRSRRQGHAGHHQEAQVWWEHNTFGRQEASSKYTFANTSLPGWMVSWDQLQRRGLLWPADKIQLLEIKYDEQLLPVTWVTPYQAWAPVS